MKYRILIIEDEKILADNIRRYLDRFNYQLISVYTGSDGLIQIDKFRPHLVILDLKLGDMSGLEIVKQLVKTHPDIHIILMTAYGSIKIAVDAMKAGVHEFLTKPIVLKDLKDKIEDILSDTKASQDNYIDDSSLSRIIGNSPPLVALKDQIKKIVKTEENTSLENAPPVLIMGETGTGKELVAQAIHYSGKRHSKPFIEINCSAIPKDLVESELFGYVQGAYTGATSNKIGLFEAAHEGTLFLDEIADMPMSAQLKLLKVIEDKEVRPLGSTKSRKINVRILAASNRSIEDLIAEKKFRSDLYYRLCVIPLHVPALRDRKNDIILLAEHFLTIQADCYNKAKPTLSNEAKTALMEHSWPGNIRELRNLMEKTILMLSVAEIKPENLSFTSSNIPAPTSTNDLDSSLNLNNSEQQLVIRALDNTGRNVTAAAKLLGISRDTLRYRIKKYNI